MDRPSAHKPEHPTLAELLARCDFARLHPARLDRNVRRWKLEAGADTFGVRRDIVCTVDEEEPCP